MTAVTCPRHEWTSTGHTKFTASWIRLYKCAFSQFRVVRSRHFGFLARTARVRAPCRKPGTHNGLEQGIFLRNFTKMFFFFKYQNFEKRSQKFNILYFTEIENWITRDEISIFFFFVWNLCEMSFGEVSQILKRIVFYNFIWYIFGKL